MGLDLIQTRIIELNYKYEGKVNIKFAGSILNRIDIRRKDHIKQAEDVYYSSIKFHSFEHWVGDWKPLYIVSDYNYPFDDEDRVARGWSGKWVSVEEKYGASAKRRSPTRSPLLSRKVGLNSPFYIREVIRSLANEFERRCP